MDVYILHIITKVFFFFFPGCWSKNQRWVYFILGGKFYGSTKVYDDDFLKNWWLNTKNLTLPLNLFFTIHCEIPYLSLVLHLHLVNMCLI